MALISFLNGAALAQSPVPARQDIETIVAEYIKTHPDELGAVVKDYVVKHPEILREIFLAIAANKMQSKAGDNAQSAAAAEKLAQTRRSGDRQRRVAVRFAAANDVGQRVRRRDPC
jgi:hypothetical protein